MTDRVAILAAFAPMGYDQDNPALLSLVDYIHGLPYPCVNGGDTNNLVGIEGDKFIVKVPFRLETAKVNGVQPLLTNVKMQVVAIKAGKNDFIVESFNINTSTSCMLNGQQNPAFTGTRNYPTFPNDPFNTISLTANSKYNSGTKVGYVFQYPLTFRYDLWNPIQTTASGGPSACGADINNDIAHVNNSWSNLSTNGWALILRFTAQVKGYDGYTTTYIGQTGITCLPSGSPATVGPNYVLSQILYDANPNSATYGNQVPSILPGSQTRISLTFTPDGSTMPTNLTGYFGTMFIVPNNSGGVTTARFASTKIPTEQGSPWSPAAQNGSPTTYTASGGLSLNVYSSGVVIIEGIYDDTILNWGNIPSVQFAFGGKLNPIDNSLQTAGGSDIETAGGRPITP